MKILLIKSEILTPIEPCVTSPLGVLCLAAVAEKMGHQVIVEDLRVFPSMGAVRKRLVDLAKWQPDVVGVSSLSTYARCFDQTAGFFRKHSPDALLVGGGPYANTETDEILTRRIVDVCVRNEGERSFENLLNAFENGADLLQVAGISFWENGRIIHNEPEPFIEDIDSIPFPAWHLFSFARYKNFGTFSGFWKPSASLYSSRGCPYNCIYCHNMFGKRYRSRSPENILNEIDTLWNRHQIRQVEFVDDTFNLDRRRAIKILQGIQQTFPQLGIAFPNGLRGDILDEEIIRHLSMANCYHIAIALESGSPRIQKVIQKYNNLDKIRVNLRLLRKYKIHTRLYIVVGFPSETLADLEQTVSFVRQNPADDSFVFIASAMNGSKLHQMIPKKKLDRLKQKKDEIDYIWGQDSLSDVPLETLQKIQVLCHSKGKLKLRNLQPLVFAMWSLFKMLAVDRNLLSVQIFGLYFLRTVGIKWGSLKTFALWMRRRKFNQFEKAVRSIQSFEENVEGTVPSFSKGLKSKLDPAKVGTTFTMH